MLKKIKKLNIKIERAIVFLIFFSAGIFGCFKFVSAVSGMNSNVGIPPAVTSQASQSDDSSQVSIVKSFNDNDKRDAVAADALLIDYPVVTEKTRQFEEGCLNSEYAILIDADSGVVLAEKNGFERINPASLTKIMTLIVAVENCENLDCTFTMTYEILAPLYRNGATLAGFVEGEQASIIDMLYGAALPSGADATGGLAEALCGSEEAFVQLMNEKAEQLGLKNTHFSNTNGLYDENNYSTPADIAVILEYAMKNDLCRQVLSTYQYTTQPTPEHPEGILLTSTMFSRMYGTEVEGVLIKGGKTGYINESRHCLASFAEKNGRNYIAVTVMGTGRYQPIYDCFEIYGEYID
ncbi:MAG: serine hydrolase [Oscillospiraceae bacterium]|jgi:D-alanyl-D-alanine carboxypeptidase (penicillin-binding protein 5/6)